MASGAKQGSLTTEMVPAKSTTNSSTSATMRASDQDILRDDPFDLRNNANNRLDQSFHANSEARDQPVNQQADDVDGCAEDPLEHFEETANLVSFNGIDPTENGCWEAHDDATSWPVQAAWTETDVDDQSLPPIGCSYDYEEAVAMQRNPFPELFPADRDSLNDYPTAIITPAAEAEWGDVFQEHEPAVRRFQRRLLRRDLEQRAGGGVEAWLTTIDDDGSESSSAQHFNDIFPFETEIEKAGLQEPAKKVPGFPEFPIGSVVMFDGYDDSYCISDDGYGDGDGWC